ALKALIVPHAGYIYSGMVAAAAFRLLRAERSRVRRVVLIGPSHRIPFRGLAVPTMRAFATPLGELPIEHEGRNVLLGLKQIRATDIPHAEEHSLEVELPFLQCLLASFELLPIAVGDASAIEVAETLEAVWGGPETLIVVSTDLSHYHDYETARILDRATNEAVLAFTERLGGEQACGCIGLNGFLRAARTRGLRIELKDLRNSGDTAGDRARVVGYGAWALFDA
ncbi:MAG TPA: AmmeMemoRadiSam system protein B, partial [Steroidobacteraceae bacterium]|nr:AmmeMemoRadiSam system protein B [Steroidobacteraceae bacterium]